MISRLARLLVVFGPTAAMMLMAGPSPASPCGVYDVTCGVSDGEIHVGDQGKIPPNAPKPVASTPGPVEVWTDCGPNLDPQIVTAADVGPCFGPLQACPLVAGKKADPNFHVFLVTTTYPNGTRTGRNECNVDVRGRQRQLSPADVEKWLVKRIPIGSIGTPNPTSLVNLKTIFWVDTKPAYQWGPLTLVQANVRIRVTLDRVHWSFGDGATDDAPDAGRPFDPAWPCDAQCIDHYGHAYITSKGVMTVRARTFWRAEFSVNGGAFVALPRPVPAHPAPPVQVTIVEARSQLVAPR